MRNKSPKTYLVLKLFLLTAICDLPVHAFDSISHDEITRSAIDYLQNHRHISPATDAWLPTQGSMDHELLVQTLVRADVDADYNTDLWLSALFHKAFTGARSGNTQSLFTGLLHSLDVTRPGKRWDYDGYSYQASTRKGWDSYMNYPTLQLRGDLSEALGGKNPEHKSHGTPLGPYNSGFKGTEAEWKHAYGARIAMSQVVFPPADVPAELAYNAIIHSPRATSSMTESWNDSIPMVTGLFSENKINRHYWRGELTGMPSELFKLGLIFHLAQDLAIPQHAMSTEDNCHQELEDLADRLACRTGKNPDQGSYVTGMFDGMDRGCDGMYDPALVEHIRATFAGLDPNADLGIRKRLQAIAMASAQWKWGEPEHSVDPVGTTLPDGRTFTADYCEELMAVEAVRVQLKYQFNLAVAATSALFEIVARDYERRMHPPLIVQKLAELFTF